MASNVTSTDSFWDEIETTPTTYSPKDKVVLQGEIIAENAEEHQMEMFSSCNQQSEYIYELFDSLPSRILDLGAGIGANTLPMAIAGAHVTAIEKSRELLLTLANESVKIGCPKENLRLRRGDITTMESYDGPFDLVMAIDIFPYLPPSALRATMEKIHTCLVDRGILVGTIFTTDLHPLARELMGQLGGHFYEHSNDLVPQLLEHSGFNMLEQTELKSTGGFQFKAEKISFKEEII